MRSFWTLRNVDPGFRPENVLAVDLAVPSSRYDARATTTFYQQLVRPDWAPPAWLFAPVWTVLYSLIGVAAWLVWRVGGFRAARTALTLFLVQLVVNALWSWLFFGWHLGGLALADILVLWVLIVATIVAFWRVAPLAGALLIPYLLWVSFAAALNHSVWQLNPRILG